MGTTQRTSGHPVDLLTWTIYHRRLLAPDRPFDLPRHLYLVDIYNATAQNVVYKKAGQMGISECLISYMLHAADQRRATCLYVFPTDTAVSDFSSARLGPAIEASAYLSSIVVEGAGSDNKRGADRVTLKRVRDRFMYMRGGKVDKEGRAPQLKSIDADVLILDEEDEMDPRAPLIAEKRLGHSSIAEQRHASTPTYAGRGIDAQWQKSDQREWFIQCEHCGQWQFMTINHIVIEWDKLDRPVAWHGQPQGRAFAACRKCTRELNRLGPGRWVAARPGVPIVGFHLTKFFSPAIDLLDIVRGLDTVDETKRKETVNQDLGETYTPRGGQLTDETLDRCRREYLHGPAFNVVCWAGVDVGKVLHCTIRALDHEAGESRQLFAGVIEGWDEMGHILNRFGAQTIVIDALPETTKAREFQAAFANRARVWLAYYGTHKAGSKLVEPEAWDWEKGIVTLDRTRTLDAMFAGFIAGVTTLPANARDLRDYYSHMKAPLRVVEVVAGGQQVAHYVESGPDHFAHAENYCLAASHAPVEHERRPPTATATSHVVRADEIFG